MNLSIKASTQIKAFLLGTVFGLLAYLIYGYLWSSNELSLETFTGLGWIFFAPQPLVYWLGSALGLSNSATFFISLTVIMLFYGYIFLAFRLHPRLALSTFCVTCFSAWAYAHWWHVMPEYAKWVPGILFWPVHLLSEIFDDTGYDNFFIRKLIEDISVGFWCAAIVCGVRNLFQPIQRPPPTTAG
jgi:hypothetical protein